MKKLLEVMKADKWMTAIVIVTLVIIILGWSGMLCLGRVHGNSMMPSFLMAIILFYLNGLHLKTKM